MSDPVLVIGATGNTGASVTAPQSAPSPTPTATTDTNPWD